MLLLLLVIWETLASSPTSSLPSPLKVWQEAGDLITMPFYVNGDTDVGLGWRILTSLERVFIGFSLAAIVGILLGVIVGQSVWAMRGLDPLFQILRTVPPLAWLPISLAAFRDANPSDFRDLHHRHLAIIIKHSGRQFATSRRITGM